MVPAQEPKEGWRVRVVQCCGVLELRMGLRR